MPRPTRFLLQKVLEPKVRRHCGPIFFTRSLKEASDNIVDNGSFGLVNTGRRKLLVTCFHVWDGFQKQREVNRELKMCLCLDPKNPIHFAPERPIDCDEQYDIATFDMEPYLSACGGLRFFDLSQYPPPAVSKGDILLMVGFPGHQRRVEDGALGFGRQAFGIEVSKVDGDRFHSDVSNLKWTKDQFGGISGCPCFCVRGTRPLRLVGFASAYLMNNLIFTHASLVTPDGAIKR